MHNYEFLYVKYVIDEQLVSSKLSWVLFAGNNYHIDIDELANDIDERTDYYNEIDKLVDSIVREQNDDKLINKRDLLEDIFSSIFEFSLSYPCMNKNVYEDGFAGFDIFETYTKFCPNYLNAYSDDVASLLHEEGIDKNQVSHYLDLQVRYEVYNACLFTALCDFLGKTKRLDSLTYSEFVYKHSFNNYSQEGTVNFIKKKGGRAQKPATFHMFETETDSFKHWRNRIFRDYGIKNKRDKWNAIPLAAEQGTAILYPVIFGSDDDFNYKRVKNHYGAIYNALKLPKDEEWQDKMDAACKKALSSINKYKYKDYLHAAKYFFQKIREEDKKKYYGINFLHFEKAHLTYAITSEVNNLLEAESEDEVLEILIKSFFLKNIYYPKIYEAFSYINDLEIIDCVLAFKELIGRTVEVSRFILDVCIEKGFFGETEEWHDLFLDILNKMVDKVFYNPDDIDYSPNPMPQMCFEDILKTSVLMYQYGYK